MNTGDQQGRSSADDTGRAAGPLTRRERQAALGIGVASGVAGGYAVFASSNQAGTVVLLLISLVFLPAGVEGTPLVRVRGSFSGGLSGHRRPSHALRQADDDKDHGRGPGAAVGVPKAEPELAPRAHADIVRHGDQVVAALADERQL